MLKIEFLPGDASFEQRSQSASLTGQDSPGEPAFAGLNNLEYPRSRPDITAGTDGVLFGVRREAVAPAIAMHAVDSCVNRVA